ncbi:putative inorganic phosphate transporter [Scheffersomyces stipitis CBS 6054]|uniref:Putative inorganic phosphate transporter n=1 Tax=Scheffersomyces stipitis (strain ATCC 58785 / CBS 6054 / NBRC 10063 / NRRL Y-11545) TaxID=322104 RepID=A3LS16_PICST|nr:putative inorganic phosphate transporter [Scheffersomyces stipitis CBS 6054]ABN65829.2 putative inorganic phosphate transporter [Scheffersomyces stipitis CBS 6054]
MSDTDNKKAEAYDATEEATKDEKPLAVQITKESDVSSFLEGELYDVDESNKSYLAKSKILADAINEIGFGRYQYGLFFVAGFGWLSDNAWPIATGLILGRLNEVDGVHAPIGKAPYLTLAQNLGLLAGALVWSLSSDIIGRRWAFNLTFLITGIFAVVAGSSPTFAAIGVFDAFWSFGVGGNLPVDSAIFLEALPKSHQWLLTVMSSWWALGQILANLISWALISNFSCDDTSDVCHKKDNWGWRYFLFTMGGITLLMFIARFAFRVFESPRFYLARGDDVRAIETIERIAKINRKECPITLADLQAIDDLHLDGEDIAPDGKKKNLLIEEKLSKYKFSHIRECFATRKLAISSSLVIFTWGIIGLAFPLYNAFLPYYLETRGDANKPLSVHDTYRNSLIVAVLGVPGALVAGVLVELRIGRKGTLLVSLILTGVFLFGSTTAKTSNANLGWNCAFSFVSNIMYGVLYAYTPEIFFTKIRGTGVGLAASFNRVLGVFAPIIAIYADLTTSAPIFVSGALFIFAGVLTVFFPYEPRGHSSF